jgi:hypothetical protein
MLRLATDRPRTIVPPAIFLCLIALEAVALVAPAQAQMPNRQIEVEKSEDVDDSGPALSVDLSCREEILLGYSNPDCWLNVHNYDPTLGPLTVVLPDAAGEGEYHTLSAAGMVLISLTGEREPQDVSEEFPILHFNAHACEPPPFTHPECEGRYTFPGPVTVPVVIRQAGQSDLEYDMVFDVQAPPEYRQQTPHWIGSRAHPGYFIDLADGGPIIGQAITARPSSLWYLEIADLDQRYFRIRNASSPDAYLSAEFDAVMVNWEPELDAEEILWQFRPAGDEGAMYFNIASVATGEYLSSADGLALGEPDGSPSQEWWLFY